MTNKPEDPQPPRPDDQSKKQHLDSDSAIDFSELNEDEMSGISVIEWASLAEAPGDPDSSKTKQVPDEGESIDLAGIVDPDSGPHLAASDKVEIDESSVDLGSEAVINLDKEAAAADHIVDFTSSDSIELGDLSIDDATDVEPVPGQGHSDIIELGEESLVGSGSAAVDDEDEAIELGFDSLIAEEGGAAGAEHSAIDFTGTGELPAARGGSSVNFGDDVLLEQAMGGSGVGPKRDLIAEGLESGVDLGNPQKHMSRGEDNDYLAHANSDETESSSVDLGSMHSLPVFDIGEEEALKAATGQPLADDDEEIDLTPLVEELQPVRPSKQLSRTVHDDSSLDEVEPVELTPVAPEKPKKAQPAAATAKPKEKGKSGAYLGGGVIGLVGGAAAMFGAAFLGLVPGLGGGAPTTNAGRVPSPQGVPNPAVAVAPAAGFDRTMDQIRAGDFHKVNPADLDKAEEDKPEQLVARAEYHWLSYLKKERGANPAAPIRSDSDEVKKAFADLDKAIAAPNPEVGAIALLLRGHIHESTGNAASALKDYQEGVTKFPQHKDRFETAKQVMELSSKLSRLMPREWPSVALVLFALQAPVGDPQAAETPMAPEPALSFLKAIVAANEKKYSEALGHLKQARDDHDKRRYQTPRKPINPTTDPSEKTFLRASDLIRQHWEMMARLSGDDYLKADPKNRLPQVDAIIAKAEGAAREAVLRDVVARLVKDKPAKTVDELVKHIAEERNANNGTIDSLKTMEKELKNDIAKRDDDLKAKSESFQKAEKAQKETSEKLATAVKEGEAAVAALREIGKAAETDFTDVNRSKDTLVKNVREAVKLAKVTDPKGAIRQLERELSADREKLARRWEPAQMLGYWLPLLDAQRDRKDLAAGALKDAERVIADDASKGTDKAKAILVQGLALRNEGRFAEALPVLKKAAAGLSDQEAVSRCEAAMKEAADPAAAVARRAAELEVMGEPTKAMEVLASGLKALPDSKGPLHLQRARLGLELAWSKGPLNNADPLVVEARKDLEQSGLPEGAYFLGRIAEELGNFAAAEKHYRAAVQGHDRDDEQGSRYKMALARVLLRSQAGARPTQTGRLPLDLVGLMVALTLQGPGNPATSEAERLAEQILAMGDKAPFDARAQALAITGRHTQAVKVYVTGLRAKGRLRGDEASMLLSLLDDHPGMQRAESKNTADPVQSERHYSAGLSLFSAGKFASAEKEFLAAIDNDGSDARYFYYLGLTLLAQGKPGAAGHIEDGARLENAGRPDRAAVSAALERIQGRMRRVLNEVRDRPARDRAAK